VTKFVILGNPNSERVTGFQQALSRQQCPPATLIPWEDFLLRTVDLSEHLSGGSILRIESAGEDLSVERLLLERGADLPDEQFTASRLEASDCLKLPEDRGRIRLPRQYFLGLRHALLETARILGAKPDVGVMNDPRDLAQILDKVTSDGLLRNSGVPRPSLLGFPRSFDELMGIMTETECSRVFVKLANGSSASGVVAFQAAGGRHLAITSAELVHDPFGVKLYNSKRIRRYTQSSEIQLLMDALCKEGVLVERWIPKSSLPGGAFDLRVLVIGGSARHTVVRQSPTPLTNLHLGKDNRRLDPHQAREQLGESAWLQALQVCEKAASTFGRCLYIGVDLLLSSRAYRPYVAEVNAFGDLLRRSIHDNRDPYEAELEQALAVST
jgi:glutathione synthase/RimK-type ligase-like ATP-grasp enzyme